jgi:hypothetical protein
MLALMRRLIVIACILIVSAGPAFAGSRNDPLVFGMTRDEVESVLQSPLIYLKGARGSERYMVQGRSSVPGIYPVDARIVLQFRRGHLTGWRRDWQMRPFWF